MKKVALITGAGSGIGREAALTFARADFNTVVVDMSAERGEETVSMIRAAGGEAIFVHTDVSSAIAVENMVASAVETYGRIDCAFNNAGISTKDFVPIAEYSEEQWDRMLDINLKGVWLCLKYECRQMLKQGGGAIVNTSSIMGVVSRPTLSGYSASKFGVIGLTKSVAMDYAKEGIRVNAVCPGGINTPMTLDPAMSERLTNNTPMGRMGEAREIAETVLWLCSDKASFITGQALCVDGGYTVC